MAAELGFSLITSGRGPTLVQECAERIQDYVRRAFAGSTACAREVHTMYRTTLHTVQAAQNHSHREEHCYTYHNGIHLDNPHQQSNSQCTSVSVAVTMRHVIARSTYVYVSWARARQLRARARDVSLARAQTKRCFTSCSHSQVSQQESRHK